jgi:hypothetical protein
VNYYGREMTPAEVYQDKLYLIRRWPIRTYHVVPGSVATSCNGDHDGCQVTLVLDFQSENPALRIGVQGKTTVSLVLSRQGGQMKIERENGVPLLRSSCKLLTPIGARSPIGDARLFNSRHFRLRDLNDQMSHGLAACTAVSLTWDLE